MKINYYELFGIKDPYKRFKEKDNLKENVQGWTGTHGFFKEIIEKVKPSIIIEIGSYLGQSAITMANALKDFSLDSNIFCVDTWLGSPEHWRSDKCNCMSLFNYFENGISGMYDQFLINMIVNKVDSIVIPIPNTSINAFDIFQWKNIKADLIYVDGSHEMMDVVNDIEKYSKLISDKGFLFGDDYRSWEGVRNGVHFAAYRLNAKIEVYYDNFWSIKL